MPRHIRLGSQQNIQSQKVARDRVAMWPKNNTARKRTLLTEPSHKVIKHSEQTRLPLELRRKRAIDRNRGRDSEDGEREVIQLLEQILPGDGRERLLVLECVRDVVVRDVDIRGLLVLGGRRQSRHGRQIIFLRVLGRGHRWRKGCHLRRWCLAGWIHARHCLRK